MCDGFSLEFFYNFINVLRRKIQVSGVSEVLRYVHMYFGYVLENVA